MCVVLYVVTTTSDLLSIPLPLPLSLPPPPLSQFCHTLEGETDFSACVAGIRLLVACAGEPKQAPYMALRGQQAVVVA